MREIVDQVLEIEKKAEQVIEQARAREAEIRAEAEAEAGSRLAQAHAEAQKLVREETDRARRESEAAFRLAMSQAEEANTDFIQRRRERADRTIERIMRLVVTPGYGNEP